MGGYETIVICNCGAKRTPFVGAVPSFEQFSAQQSRAVALCACSLGMSAALQHSISPIAWSMPQDCSPNCTGTPPNALPLSINTNTKDVSRIRMAVTYSMDGFFNCQGDLGLVLALKTPPLYTEFPTYFSFFSNEQKHDDQ